MVSQPGVRVNERDRDLELSRVLSVALLSLGRQPVTALVFAVVLIYLPIFSLARFWPPAPASVFSLDFVIYAVGLTPLVAICALFSAWVAHQAVRPPTRAASGSAASQAFAVFLTSIIVSAGAIVGAVLFVAPGVIWLLACCVAIPVAAIERLSPLASIRRSFALSGNRLWIIFGYMAAVFLPLAAAVTLLELALVGWDVHARERSEVIVYVLRPIADTLSAVLGASMSAALYSELTRLEIAQSAELRRPAH